MALPNPDSPAVTETTKATPNRWAVALSSISIVGLVLLVILMFLNFPPISPLLLWGLIAGLMIFLLIALGLGANGKVYGILIDTRNRTSLSRMQMTLWTVLALSAFLAIALPRSMPGALGTASALAIQECETNYIKDIEQIDDLETLRNDDPQAATLAEENAAAECRPDPLKITFPPELIVALGISTASFAGSSIIQSNKRNKSTLALIKEREDNKKEADSKVEEKEAALLSANTEVAQASQAKKEANKVINDPNASPEEKSKAQADLASAQQAEETAKANQTKAQKEYDEAEDVYKDALNKWEEAQGKKDGLLKVNDSPKQAKFGDIFQGDELGNYYLVDLSKVQMFFFTIAIFVAYGVALSSVIQNQSILMHPLGVDFPAFSSSLNTLLGISHAGYLTVKSVDHTKTN